MGNNNNKLIIKKNNNKIINFVDKIYNSYINYCIIRKNFNNLKKNYQHYIELVINNLNTNKEKLSLGKRFTVDIDTLKYYIKKYYYGNNKFRKLTFGEYISFKDRLAKSKYYTDNKYIIIEGYVNINSQYILCIKTDTQVKIVYKIYDLNGKKFPETPL